MFCQYILRKKIVKKMNLGKKFIQKLFERTKRTSLLSSKLDGIVSFFVKIFEWTFNLF